MDTPTLETEIYKLLETVKDPEIPVLSILDLGIVRSLNIGSDNHVTVTITPTYTGCPAMDTISDDIRICLKEAGFQTEIETVISPAWTTDWISEKGRKNLEEYGIAPPVGSSSDKSVLTKTQKSIRCPQCKSFDTVVISPFGSTACKALYKCNNCLEPFDYFKCL